MKAESRPILVNLLIILLILLGLGGIGGAVAMFLDPTGVSMGLPLRLLDGLPISNFILPGLFLLVVMGIAPLVIAYGAWKRLSWSWAAALAQSIALILWIGLQIALWGTPVAIQIVYMVWGVVMLGLCLPQTVRNYFNR